MKKKEEFFVLIDLNLYSLRAIYGALYVFLDKAYFFLEEESKSKIKINIKPKENLKENERNILKDNFLNEIINFSLRDSISKDNQKIREYIISTAIASSLSLVNLKENRSRNSSENDLLDIGKNFVVPWDNEDSLIEEDPEGILIPWEENKKKKKKKKK
jgi:His-Xaa-Ser system protein HxsD